MERARTVKERPVTDRPWKARTEWNFAGKMADWTGHGKGKYSEKERPIG